nr:4Fe-4S binding protein [Candidatus Sigynarchaeota archaeon]
MSLYHKLRHHFDTGPLPFPETSTGVEIRLLQDFFSESDCRILLALGWVRITAEKCHERLRKDGAPEGALPLDELKARLDKLYVQGSISMKVKKGKKMYCIDPVAIGWYEHKVDFLTPKQVQMFYEYADQAFPGLWGGDGIGKGIPPQMRVLIHPEAINTQEQSASTGRVVDINESLTHKPTVASHDDVRRLLRGLPDDHLFVLVNCICKQSQDLVAKPCKVTDHRRHCMSMGTSAQAYLDRGQGTRISKEEAIKMLEWQIKEGLVLQCGNYADELREVCACCGCCCGVLTNAKKLKKPTDIFHVTYQAAIQDGQCKKCGTCAKRCQMDAIIQEGEGKEKKFHVDLDRCIGCGVCVSGCKSNAINLVKKQTYLPPSTKDDFVKQRLKHRHGLAGYIRFIFKALLGMRI